MRKAISFMLALMLMFGAAVPAAAAEGDGMTGDGAVWEDYVQPDAPGGMEGMPQGDPAYDGSEELTDEPEVQPMETPAPEQEMPPVPEHEPAPGPEDIPGFEDVPSFEVVPGDEGETAPAPETEATPLPEAIETPMPDEFGMEPSGEPSEEPVDELELISEIPASSGEVDFIIQEDVARGTWTPSFTVTLTGGEDGTTRQETVSADGLRHSFADLMQGSYTLTVSGEGFAAYTQTVSVGPSDGILLQMTVGRLAGYGAAHPGILRLGDVNGDGVLDGTDTSLMMQAVDMRLTASAGVSEKGFTDLNGDGVTDLADAELQAKAVSYGGLEDSDKLATAERFIPATAIGTYKADTTSVTGDVKSLFQEGGMGVQLGNADNEPISADNAVQVDFEMAAGAMTDAIVLENTNISAGEIVVEDVSGEMHTFAIGAAPETADVAMVIAAAVPGGDITVDLGEKIAVKRVTLKITGVNGADTSLASISQVEFVNGMENRIPEPVSDVPANVTAVPGSRQFTVSWTACQNITGYEVKVSQGGAEETYELGGTSLTVTNFGGDELLNYTTYTVQVQSVNGKWASGWSGAVTVTPEPTGRPDKPDNVRAEGGFQSVTVYWKDMKDTQSYNLYYKEESAEEFTKLALEKVTSWTIDGLNSDVETTYEVYVTGENVFGESEPSMHASATTVTLDPADMSRYNLINCDEAGNPGRSHIVSAVANAGGSMFNSPDDPEGSGSAWGTVDGSGASFYERKTWDDGGFNNLGSGVGLTYTFDQAYKMDTIGVMNIRTKLAYSYAKIRWWDAAGAEHFIDKGEMRVHELRDANGRAYYFLRLPYPIEAKSIQIGLARGWVDNLISVSEVYFYRYDSLKQEIMDLYADALHTELKDSVTEDTLKDLEARIETSVDRFGNVNPDKDVIRKELQTAWDIFNKKFNSQITIVHTGITGSGDEHGFGGLNAWQPLGVTAAAGDKITVYVSHGEQATGTNTALQLVATQYHAEASAMSTVVGTLKVGANEITVPKIWTNTGMESGGALYVQYTGGASGADDYAVRVNGGVAVPVLDLYHVADPGTRASRVSDYVAALQTYVNAITETHAEAHQGEKASPYAKFDYEENNCILGATDIMLDTMMLSLPAQQVLAGCGGNPGKLLGSLNAMENMMKLFYQHKGLNASAPDAVDRIPNRHLNIRYQRMFSGAFMYASGDHIGIEWKETAGMASCGGVKTDGSGRWSEGNYFGWGIAHEIGHDINQGLYAIAEITNNYFAVLAQAKDTNDSVRFLYDNVYAKVTSGTKGRASNVFTQLGMYWQLHLAYDKGYNFKTYDSYEEQLANLFWARVDTYARTPGKAPNGLSLKDADSEQALMRLCCAAANRNILDFFVRWGKTPDQGTIDYASKFAPETRAIYYVCDDSRVYTLTHDGSALGESGAVDAIASVDMAVDPNSANKIKLSIHPNEAVSADAILGYEIVRCTISGGKVEKKTVGFATSSEFTDVVSAMNNRAVSYEITLVDQYLNRSAVEVTGAVKVRHEGDLDKAHWTVITAGLDAEPICSEANDDDPEVIETDPAVYAADGKQETVYTATVRESASIELDFHEVHTITGFRYTAGEGGAVTGCSVDVRQNGEWIRAAEGALVSGQSVYFKNPAGNYVSTYAADALRLNITGQTGETVTVAELDVLSKSGDNVDFGQSDTGAVSVGYLTADYKYGTEAADVIKAGSLVFTGTYAGNAAYNVVMLYDQDGNVVAARAADGSQTAYQVILADVPKTGNIEDVTDGQWLYWIDVADLGGFQLPAKVRAELYRVNDAQTNEGERLVSDSLFFDVPQQPGAITLSGGAVG